MTLLEIPKAIDDAIDFFIDPETGEIKSEEETLAICEQLEGERLGKIGWLAKRVVNSAAELEALQDHKRTIDARIKAKKNEIERLKRFIGLALNYEKYTTEDGLVKISYRTTKDSVKLDNLDEIPIEYFKTPRTESNVSKTAIKEMIQAGEIVPGAHLEDSISTIIK